MSELRKRVGGNAKDDSEPEDKFEESIPKPEMTDSEDSDSEDVPGISLQSTAKEKSIADKLKNATSGTDTTPEVFESVTRNMSTRWKNWTVRFILGLGMICGFLWIMYMGPIALVLLVMVIQLKCFSEIINIGYIVYKSQNLAWFRTLSWYFLFTSNYYIYGETMIDQFGMLLDTTNLLRPIVTYHRFWHFVQNLVTYHRFISFSLYMAGVMFFIAILKKRHYVKQFSLALSSLYRGSPYIAGAGRCPGEPVEICPVGIVISPALNDPTRTFGNNITVIPLSARNFLNPSVPLSSQLVKLGLLLGIGEILKNKFASPLVAMNFGYTHVTLLIIAVGANLIIRNVFEGIFWFFLACSAIICNDIWAYFFGFFFGRTPLIKLSPKKTWEGYLGGGFATLLYAVIVSYVMVHYDSLVCPLEYSLHKDTMSLEGCVRNPVFVLHNYTLPKILQTLSSRQTVEIYPIIFHALFLAAFASLIGPFGGFFASGFKRAFKIKDFGDIFPGHGGFMDRFDCQVLMGIFTNIYISSFVKIPNPARLLTYIYAMQTNDQLTLLQDLCEGLQSKGLVNCSVTGNGA